MTQKLALLALTIGASFGGVLPRLVAPSPAPPARMPAAIPEINPGGYILFQPFNHADGVVADGTHTHNGKTYTQTKVRWAAVGFLHIETGESEGQRVEHWYLSKGNETSSTSNTNAPFVEEYYWPGRNTPTADKHAYWSDLPVRFVRRNDLSGAAGLTEFVAEVSETYGYDVTAAGGKFERHDATSALASGY